MGELWEPEEVVSPSLARRLIEAEGFFSGPFTLEPFGEGWDNTAFLVTEDSDTPWVFRFPRREVAVSLLANECAILPAVAAGLPLPVPEPVHLGRPSEAFRWPFAGYRHLAGRTACSFRLPSEERDHLARPVARFLSALHACPAEEAHARGVPTDEYRRLEVPYRCTQTAERLRSLRDANVLSDLAPLERILEEAPQDWVPGCGQLCHGDFYARHLLLSEGEVAGGPGTTRATGVIDWGDVHVGDAAVDLGFAHAFFPPRGREIFRDAYGVVKEDAWRAARLRALATTAASLQYGLDVGDRALELEARLALEHLVL